MRIGREASGFTLLELLSASLIFTLLMSALYSTFSQGIISIRKGRDVTESIQNIGATFSILSRDLHNIYGGLRCKGEEMKFKTHSSLNDKIEEVSYRLLSHGGLGGSYKLVRRKGSEEFALLEGVKKVEFRFYDPREERWESKWEKPYLPSRVKIEVVVKSRERYLTAVHLPYMSEYE